MYLYQCIFSILINLVAILNIYELFYFYKECPYNFSYNVIKKIFKINYNENDDNNINLSYSKKCSNNRCLSIMENSTYFLFLCLFDSSYDFQNFNDKLAILFSTKIKNNNYSEIICSKFYLEDFDNIEIFKEKNEYFFYN